MPAPTPVIRSGMRVVCGGDSISAPDRRCLQPMLDTLATVSTGSGTGGAVTISGSNATLGAGGVPGAARTGVRPDVIWAGIPGQRSLEFSQGITTQVLNYNPQLITILMGVNDAIIGGGTTPTPLVTYTANMNLALSTIRTALPTVPIILMQVWCFGEQWTAGPAWANTQGNTTIAGYNGALSTLAGTYGCVMANIRDDLLVKEAANNTPAPGVNTGFYSTDGIHPTITASAPGLLTGRQQISNVVLPLLTVQ